jgi:hypothetical protein
MLLQQQDIADDEISPDAFSSTACGMAKSNKVNVILSIG